MSQSNGHKPQIDYELCGVVCGAGGFGTCQKPEGHLGKVHDPRIFNERGYTTPDFIDDGLTPGWSDDPRHEQDAIYREITA